ncbi:MAG: hypothetical protein Q8Q41_00595 [bacterium]|nr:hypothetical protein [bacterium]
MKSLLRLTVLVGTGTLLLLSAGCSGYTVHGGPSIRVESTVPFHGATVKVVNGTNLAVQLVDDNGRRAEVVPPGQVVVHRFWNFSGTSAEFSLLAIATDERGALVGIASKQIRVSGNSKQSEPWILRKRDFRQ